MHCAMKYYLLSDYLFVHCIQLFFHLCKRIVQFAFGLILLQFCIFSARNCIQRAPILSSIGIESVHEALKIKKVQIINRWNVVR